VTASDILNRWRRVRPVLNQTSLWFTLLTIAEAGENGIGRHDLAAKTGAKMASFAHSIKSLRASGLIQERQRISERGGRAAIIATITPKGLDFLAIKPTKNTTA